MSSESQSKSSSHDEHEERDLDFSKLGKDADASEATSSEAKGDEGTSGDMAEALAQARREAEESKDKYLRALADFENYKKRAIKERSEILKYQGEKILVDLVDVLDNLGLALKFKDTEPEKLRSGLEMIHKLFLDTLARWEVRPESGLGKPFDPSKFEAISRMAVDDAAPGTIINEFKVAYLYKDRLLRPGSVVVAAEPETPGDASEESSAGDDTDGGEESETES